MSSISSHKEVTPFPLKRKCQVALDICEYFPLYWDKLLYRSTAYIILMRTF